MSGRFTQRSDFASGDFDRLPVIGAPRRRPRGRTAAIVIVFLIGLALGMLIR